MSWIFGAYGKLTNEDLRKAQTIHPETEDKVITKNYYLACGGVKSTIHFYHSNQNNIQSGVAVCGTGFEIADSKYKLLNENDWYNVVLKKDHRTKKIEGHYCGVFWEENRIEIFTDSGGVYDIYYFKLNQLLYFSTDIFLLNKLANSSEIDIDVFASRWLCVNQMSDGSIIKNITRLCKGNRILINESGLTLHPTDKLNFENADHNNLENVLSEIFRAIFNSGFNVSLSFSGGMDSRFLLSLLTSSDDNNFSLHTFGHPNHSDFIIASTIAKDLNLRHEQFYSPDIKDTECINLICDYIKNVICINPCSSSFQLRYYHLLYDKNTIIVDGGLGGIGRRQYMNRILYGNKRIILNKQADKLFEKLKLERADIFNEDAKRKMVNSSIEDITHIIAALPDAWKTGTENWADIFIYTTRLPNFYGPEQKRMNNYVINLMPFCLKSVFDSIISIKVKERRNGKKYKKIISKNNYELTRYPLVQGNSLYPFSSGTLMSKFYVVYDKIQNKKTDIPDDKIYLVKVKEFVLDLLNSEAVKNYAMYDYKKISQNVNRYYSGDLSLASYVDWWLSFEILRRYIYKINF